MEIVVMRAPEPSALRRRRVVATCRNCGETKPTASGFPDLLARWCTDCRTCSVCRCRLCSHGVQSCSRECAAVARTARALAARVKAGCTACGLPKPRDEENFAVCKRDADGQALKFDAWCRSCRSAYQRDKYATSPEMRALAIARAARARAAREKRVAEDPEYAERWRQQKARWNRAERERRKARKAAPQKDPNNLGGRRTGAKMPVAPLLEVLDGLAASRRADGGTYSFDLLCESVGIAGRTVSRWRRGEVENVSLPTADAILVNTHLNLHDVWDEQQLREGEVAA